MGNTPGGDDGYDENPKLRRRDLVTETELLEFLKSSMAPDIDVFVARDVARREFALGVDLLFTVDEINVSEKDLRSPDSENFIKAAAAVLQLGLAAKMLDWLKANEPKVIALHVQEEVAEQLICLGLVDGKMSQLPNNLEV
jgi:hypothetical protein